MGVAGPCDILVSSAGMNPSLKGVATFSADYLSWKSISLLVFVTTFFDTFFKGTLWYKRICCLKVWVDDNCFMMIRCHVLINFTIICVAVEVFIRVCFLKDDITRIFFIGENASNSAGSPACVFLGNSRDSKGVFWSFFSMSRWIGNIGSRSYDWGATLFIIKKSKE